MSVDASLFLVSVLMGTRLRGVPDGAPLNHGVKVCRQPPRGFHILRILDLLVKKWRGGRPERLWTHSPSAYLADMEACLNSTLHSIGQLCGHKLTP